MAANMMNGIAGGPKQGVMTTSFGEELGPRPNRCDAERVPRLCVVTTPSVRSHHMTSGVAGPNVNPPSRFQSGIVRRPFEAEIEIAAGVLPVETTRWMKIGPFRKGVPGV